VSSALGLRATNHTHGIHEDFLREVLQSLGKDQLSITRSTDINNYVSIFLGLVKSSDSELLQRDIEPSVDPLCFFRFNFQLDVSGRFKVIPIKEH